MDFPSGRVPQWAPERFLVATDACDDRTPDLGYVLGFSVYIRGFGVKNKLGGSPGCPQGRGRALGGWAPPTLVAARVSPDLNSKFPGLLSFQK